MSLQLSSKVFVYMLSEALRLIRVFHDLKQKDLAKKLDISSSYLSEIETGLKKPSIELINRYSSIFDIPASSILFFSEHIDDGNTDEIKTFVASKVLKFLSMLESKNSLEA